MHRRRLRAYLAFNNIPTNRLASSWCLRLPLLTLCDANVADADTATDICRAVASTVCAFVSAADSSAADSNGLFPRVVFFFSFSFFFFFSLGTLPVSAIAKRFTRLVEVMRLTRRPGGQNPVTTREPNPKKQGGDCCRAAACGLRCGVPPARPRRESPRSRHLQLALF